MKATFQMTMLVMNRPLFCATLALLTSISAYSEDLGLFDNQIDVGKATHAGSASFDPSSRSYSIAGGGENMWFTNDAFHFVWTRVSGDFALQAAIEWLGAGGNPHKKACLIARQSLAPDAPYVDVAVHGDGLVSLQYRELPAGPTREIQAIVGQTPRLPAARLALERQGELFFISTIVATDRSPASGVTHPPTLQPSGAFFRLRMTDPLYVGLAVCAHDDTKLEKARFSHVELLHHQLSNEKPVLHSTLETVNISSRDRRVIYHTLDHLEAPNWSRDGTFFLFNSGGHIYRLPVQGGKPVRIDTGFAERCNNDHGLSPDGQLLAISDQSRGGKSLIYLIPLAGGLPRRVTSFGPSYWHGWSPDGLTLAYCAERNGEFDVFTIPAAGGDETRLTFAKGLDDGPDYSPDGKFIYFNSERTGTMQIWRMKPNGADQEQVTSDEFNNWFPHPSPDGKWLAFLSYEKEVTGHPVNHPVRLRLLPLAGGPSQELAKLFGGQGTINVPSWSPDSRQLAFISYELIRP